MKKICVILVCLTIVLFCSWSQDARESIVDTFIANFEKGSPAVKLQVLQDAANSALAGMGPLYLKSIDFLLNSVDLFDTDLIYRKISTLTVNSIKGEQYTKAKDSLWALFIADTNSVVRVGILEALKGIAAGDSKTIKAVNGWLDSQNSVFKTGATPDLQVILACVQVLGVFGDPTSFPFLFSAWILEYSDAITPEVEKSMGMIKGDFKQLYSSIIRLNFFEEKYRALKRALSDTNFSDTDKCEIAEYAMSIALYNQLNTVEDKQLARETRYLAVSFLSSKKWSNATELVIEHLNRTISELDKGIARKNYLLDAINALGNMQTHEAAKRLTLYLDHINSFTENGRAYDEQIVLQVIDSLGVLGDAVAMENLLYTKYLNYSDRVKKAAATAIKNLQ